MGVFNTLCLDGTMDEWLTDIEEANVPHAWADDGWFGMSPHELACVFTYLTILLTLGDLTVESGILTSSQGEMFWAYRQALIHYPSGPLVHKIVVDLSRMVRACLMELTLKKKAVEGGAKTSRMAYGKEDPSIAISQNSGKKQVAARLRSYRLIARGGRNRGDASAWRTASRRAREVRGLPRRRSGLRSMRGLCAARSTSSRSPSA